MTPRLLAAALVLTACALAASCATPSYETVQGRNWAGPARSAKDMSFFPGGRYRPGMAALNCMMMADRRISQCEVVWETPAGEGFGKAALDMAVDVLITPDQAAMAIRDQARRPVPGTPPGGGWILLPVKFCLYKDCGDLDARWNAGGHAEARAASAAIIAARRAGT